MMNTNEPESYTNFEENEHRQKTEPFDTGYSPDDGIGMPGPRSTKKMPRRRNKATAFIVLAVLIALIGSGAFFGRKVLAEKVTGKDTNSTVSIGSTADLNEETKAGAEADKAADPAAAEEQAREEKPQTPVVDRQDTPEEAENEADQAATDGQPAVTQNGSAIGSTAEANMQSTLTKASSETNYDLTVADIAKNTMPAMVAITNTSVEKVRNFFYGGFQDYESVSKGTGVIVGQNENEILIATNAHVVENADSLSVTFSDDSTVEGLVKGSDTKNDLAVVAVPISDVSAETLSVIKFVEIGDSDAAMVGEQVVAIGNALGYGQSVSSGYLSAKNRGVETESGETEGLLQTDAAINPGNSGGALLNMQGQLIGINSAKYADTQVEGMGFAIPINKAAPILEKMMNKETRQKVSSDKAAYFGITCLTVSQEAAQYYRIPEGVYVQDVMSGSAAEKAGIRQGDIITAIDDESVTTDEELTNTLKYYAAGDTAQITISRAGEGGQYSEQVLTITFDLRPAESEAEAGDQFEQNDGQNGWPGQGGWPSQRP